MNTLLFGTLTAATAALVLVPVPARAQAELSVNPYIGWYDFDESSFEEAFDDVEVDADPMLGARLGVGDRTGLSLDLAYGRTTVEGEIVADDIVLPEDSTIHLFYGAVNYGLPLPIAIFVSGGAGAIRYSPEDRDATTNVLVNYGAGIAIPLGNLRLRADAKDHVDLCDAPDSDDFTNFGACLEDEALHNIELSAGIEIAL
jgi:hypothetical protein